MTTDELRNTMKVKLTFTEPVLGACPSDKEIYSTYVASKSGDKDLKKDEVDNFDPGEDAVVEDKSITVFPKLDDGTPYLYDYQIKGMFKNACYMLKKIPNTESSAIKAYKKDIGGLIFIDERRIPIHNYGEIGNLQRPLRAQTMQGDRIALANSEMINPGAYVEFTINCLDPNYIEAIKEWLDYGKLNGLLQFHNGGYGRFTYEILSCSVKTPKTRGRKKKEEVSE